MADPVVEQEVVEATPEQQEKEASAALSAGYNRVHGEPTPTEAPKTPGREEVAPQEPEAAKEAAPDPWAGVNPELKKTLEGISTRLGEVDKLGQRFKSLEGRVGHVQNAIAAANAAAKASGTEAPTPGQLKEAMQSTAKWDALMADFPDWKDPFEERLAAHAANISKNIPTVDVTKIKEELEAGFSQALVDITRASTQEARQLAQLDIKHPGWETKIATKDFSDWLFAGGPTEQEQARYFELKKTSPSEADAFYAEFARTHPQWWGDRGAANASSNAADAIRQLDAYEEHRKAVEKQAKNQARLATVVAPKQATSGGPSVLPDEAGLAVGYKRAKRA